MCVGVGWGGGGCNSVCGRGLKLVRFDICYQFIGPSLWEMRIRIVLGVTLHSERFILHATRGYIVDLSNGIWRTQLEDSTAEILKYA